MARTGNGSVGEHFGAQVLRTPSAIALEAADRRLTYAELDACASRLAKTLMERGVGRDVLVALCAERSMDTLVALLAIVKAGGAYLPLDPRYPGARLEQLLADVKPGLVLTTGDARAHHLPLLDAALSIDGCSATGLNAEPSHAQVNSGDDLIYAMFTSGSTGAPKAVAVPHRAVVRLVIGADYADLGPTQTFVQLSALAFDAATLEIWGAWLNGGRLVLPPAGAPSLAEIGRIIREQGVTTLWITAGLFHLMVDERLEDFRPLQQLLSGGDVLSVAHVRRVRSALPHVRLINGYGPTENTTFSTCYTIPADVPDRALPIGRAINGTSLHVLDENLRDAPQGGEGELFVGGLGLARGYLGRPELTAERFLEVRDEHRDLGRLYRTGDLVRMLPDGNLEFIGRRDGQVKVRGFRVELGEIESQLRAQAEVRDAIVRARSLGGGDKQLVAYVVPHPETPANLPSQLRSRLAGLLPEYMMPSAIVLMESFPLNANGKVDVAALPAPTSAVAEGALPRTELEQAIAGVWREVLELPVVGAHDHFFEIGGTSLRLARVHDRLQALIGRELPITVLFERPTIASLAEHLAGGAAPGTGLLDRAKDRAALQRASQLRAQAARGKKP